MAVDVVKEPDEVTGGVPAEHCCVCRRRTRFWYGLMFDAFGAPRTRYVRVTLDSRHCVMRPSEGDTYIEDASACGDNYIVRDVYLSEREFNDLPEFDGF